MYVVVYVLLAVHCACAGCTRAAHLDSTSQQSVSVTSDSSKREEGHEYFSSVERSLLATGQGEINRQWWMEQHADGGLAPKPEGVGPDSPAWRNSIALCSMIKDENSTDVREWVMYYR